MRDVLQPNPLRETGMRSGRVGCAFLIFLIVLAFNARAHGDSPSLTLSSHAAYLDSDGSYHVIGEVANTGSEYLEAIEVTAEFYDRSGVLIDEQVVPTLIDVLPPEKNAPFEIVEDETISEDIQDYTLSTSYQISSSRPDISLDFLGVGSGLNEEGRLVVEGQVLNIGTSVAEEIHVVGAFHNERGEVVGVGYTTPYPTTLQPGQAGTFLMVVGQELGAPSQYVLQAESINYVVGEVTETATTTVSSSSTTTVSSSSTTTVSSSSTTTVSSSSTTVGTGFTLTVSFKGSAYTIALSTNATAADLRFDSDRRLFNFTFGGADGTVGHFLVLVPKALLDGSPVVFVDNIEVSRRIAENSTHYTIGFDYPLSQHVVSIGGSNTIPEFPSPPMLVVAFIFVTAILTRLRRQWHC